MSRPAQLLTTVGYAAAGAYLWWAWDLPVSFVAAILWPWVLATMLTSLLATALLEGGRFWVVGELLAFAALVSPTAALLHFFNSMIVE
jgi:hypothetical protein